MKKTFVKLGMSVMLCSSLHAFDYNVVNGGQHLGAVIDIDDLSVFNHSSVEYIYQIDFTKPTLAYNYYEVNGTFPEKSIGTAITSLKKGEGFILHANSSAVISDTPSGIPFGDHTYEEVISPTTQRVWLSKNIGAATVCSKRRNEFSSDAAYVTSQEDCFGDYYQWGRRADGHESNASTTTTLASHWSAAGTTAFIKADSSSHDYDWERTSDDDGTSRANFLARTDGTGVCPTGFRVPTISELNDEAANLNNMHNVLKFPIAGKRDRTSGSYFYKGYVGYLWSTSPGDLHNDVRTHRLIYDDNGFNDATDDRGYGYSIRCIKH